MYTNDEHHNLDVDKVTHVSVVGDETGFEIFANRVGSAGIEKRQSLGQGRGKALFEEAWRFADSVGLASDLGFLHEMTRDKYRQPKLALG